MAASNNAVTAPASASRLANASLGMSIAGIIVTVVIVIVVVTVIAGTPSSCRYTYNGNCYRDRSYVGDYGYCSGVKDYFNDYCYYND